MSIASLRNPRLHFMVYPANVPPWLVARIAFDPDGLGARLELQPGLNSRDQLRALAWAGAVLPSYLRPDGTGYLNDSVVPTLPVTDTRFDRVIPLATCVDCDEPFDVDSSPRDDLCWCCGMAAA